MSQAFRCDGLDTPQAYIQNKKNSQKIWAVEIKGLGPNSPFWEMSKLFVKGEFGEMAELSDYGEFGELGEQSDQDELSE